MRVRSMMVVLLAVGALLPGASVFSARDAQGFVRIAPEDLHWMDVPGGNGLQSAVVEGDPTKAGVYVIRVKFPRGVMTRNHHHPEDRHATVLAGTWWTGTGDVFDPATTIPLKPGSCMKHPAGAHHFDGAKDEEVIVQIIGQGPSETTLLRPQEGLVGPSR